MKVRKVSMSNYTDWRIAAITHTNFPNFYVRYLKHATQRHIRYHHFVK